MVAVISASTCGSMAAADRPSASRAATQLGRAASEPHASELTVNGHPGDIHAPVAEQVAEAAAGNQARRVGECVAADDQLEERVARCRSCRSDGAATLTTKKSNCAMNVAVSSTVRALPVMCGAGPASRAAAASGTGFIQGLLTWISIVANTHYGD